MTEFMIRAVAYGMLGLLIENIFTGIRSILVKNWFGTCTTYLWMFPIYSACALSLEFLHAALDWHWLLMAPLYTATIYAVEFGSGYLLKRFLGACPWDYGLSRWTPLGLINFKYLPFWLGLACAFNPLSKFMSEAVELLARLLLSV